MHSTFSHVLLMVGLVLVPAVSFASDLELRLQVRWRDEEIEASQTRQFPTPEKAPPRDSFKVAAGEPLSVRWEAMNTAPNEVYKNVLVHFFVVREQELGQAEIPPLDEGVPHEGAITVDFEPQEQATGEFTLTIEDPGPYLLRVETVGMLDQHGHDHYVALDVLAE